MANLLSNCVNISMAKEGKEKKKDMEMVARSPYLNPLFPLKKPISDPFIETDWLRTKKIVYSF